MSAEQQGYEPDQVLDHEYDGIQEYDNRLPNWWLWTLWGTIIFSVGYWFAFHTYGWAMNPVDKYEAAMNESSAAIAEVGEPAITEAELVAKTTDPEVLALGQEVYAQYCQVCHLAEGQGLVGPNLTDDYWIHGGSAMDIHDTIVNGVVEKGMAAWGDQLGPERVNAVVAYLLTFRGTNVEGKAPQGELYQAEAEGEMPAGSGESDEAREGDVVGG